MVKRLSSDKIEKIKFLREKGFSLPEIKKRLNLANATIYRYIKNIEILPKYRKVWFGKRGGSIKRRHIAENNAKERARRTMLLALD
ncbi:MAG TPA: hypothetical protein VJH96_00270 [Patescibacteria group bacterium]|nr:hypothetical protein [Patescibacteria group bacterium]